MIGYLVPGISLVVEKDLTRCPFRGSRKGRQ
jgi:hypothetical protein